MKPKLLIAAIAVVIALGILVMRNQPSAAPDKPVAAAASSEPAPRIESPARAAAPTAYPAETETVPHPNLYERIHDEHSAPPRPTAEQLAGYLELNHTNAASLLAA